MTLAACSYLTFPLFGLLSVFGWLVVAACWLTAVVGSLGALKSLVGRRAYGSAAGVLAVALLSGTGMVVTNWQWVYVDSQIRMHRGELAELAARHRTGSLSPDVALPWSLRYLSIDGHAHLRDGALYLPAWQDWRGERGGGFAYFPTPPDQNTIIATAAGDIGLPVRNLGDGWWWVE